MNLTVDPSETLNSAAEKTGRVLATCCQKPRVSSNLRTATPADGEIVPPALIVSRPFGALMSAARTMLLAAFNVSCEDDDHAIGAETVMLPSWLPPPDPVLTTTLAVAS